MVAEAFPALVYGHPQTYVVEAANADGTLDLSPPVNAQHLPLLRRVEQWAVALLEPTAGIEVVVVFRDAKPSRPVVLGAVAGAGAGLPAPPADPIGRVVRWGDIGTGVGPGSPMPLVPHATNPSVSRVKG